MTDPRTVKVTGKDVFDEVRAVRKVDMGRTRVMKTLKEMSKNDQVRSLCPVPTLCAMRYGDLAEMGLTNFRTMKIAGKSTFGGVRVVQKVGTGGIYAMKTSKKEDILGEDQVRSLHPPFTLYVMRPFTRPPSSVRSRPHRAWCPRRIQLSVGRAIVLLIPAPYVLVPHHGVPGQRRLNDNACQVRHLRGLM